MQFLNIKSFILIISNNFNKFYLQVKNLSW